MNKQQQPISFSKLIEKLRNEYNDLSGKIARLNAFLCDIDFVEKVPDIVEQELMEGQLRAMKTYLVSLRGRIMLQEARLKKDEEFDNWMNMKGRVVNTMCGPVHLVNQDEQNHHCGRDADLDDACCQAREKRPVGDGSAAVNEIPDSIKSLEGMQVIKVCGPKCKDCPCGDGLREYPSGRDMSSCVKVELVGGYTLCLSQLPNSIVIE